MWKVRGGGYIGFWFWKLEGNIQRGRMGDKIKMDIKEIMCEDMDSINMAQDVDKLRYVDNKFN
jgi:hypothetical protein